VSEDNIDVLRQRLKRERRRRQEAERLAEGTTRDLYLRSQRIEVANEELERMLYVASHHLQEPVRGVVAHLQSIERTVDEGAFSA